MLKYTAIKKLLKPTKTYADYIRKTEEYNLLNKKNLTDFEKEVLKKLQGKKYNFAKFN